MRYSYANIIFKNTYFVEYLQQLFLPMEASAVEKVSKFIFIYLN